MIRNDSINVGIDDFAIKKKHTYGTLMVDLDRRKTIDMIDSREISDVTTWLNTFPSLKIISRDGSLIYKKAIESTTANPIQISDRFHLIKNCSEAIAEVLKSEIRDRIVVKSIEVNGLAKSFLKVRFEKAVQDYKSGKNRTTVCKENRLDIRTFDKLLQLSEEELRRYFQTKDEVRQKDRFDVKKRLILSVQELHKKGLSKSEIGRRLNLDRRTVEKYIRKDAVSKYEKRVTRQRHNRLDEYSEDIITMIDSGATQSNIFKYLLGKGYKGSYSSLRVFISTRKRKSKLLTTKTLGFLEVRDILYHERNPQIISREEIMKFLDVYPTARTLIALMHEFDYILTKSKSLKALNKWVGKASKFKGLNSFLNGMERDWDAVKNSLCYSYSNGLIESKVNKTKLFKRNMYGRCSFKTLRNKAIIYDSIFQ